MVSSSSQGFRSSERVKGVKYAVRDVVVQAQRLKAQGKRMLWLNIGDPNPFGFAPPPDMVDAMVEAMRRNANGYAPSNGIPEAIEAIEDDGRRKGLRKPCLTWIGSGCSEVIDMALTAMLNPGESVLTPSPGYPLYTALLAKLGANSQPYQLNEAKGWVPDLEDIERQIDGSTRAIVVINPNNPTGSVSDRETLMGVVALAKKHDLLVIADEIYDRILLDGDEHVSIGSLDPEASVLTLGGLSKNWIVPGWRLGWGMLTGKESHLADYKEAIQQLGRARLSANHPEQFAILPALRGDQSHLKELNDGVRARRDLCMGILNESERISCVSPEGAFYAFPRLHGVEDDNRWCSELMAETGVVVVPGSGFGQAPGTQHFRIVLLPSLEELEEACRAIVSFAAAH